MNLSRRHFLKSSLASTALGTGSLALFNRQLQAAANPNKKMIFIFQRGGNDCVNTVIPRGDSEYNDINRPSIFIAENQALDLGNGFAQLHPSVNAG